MACSDDERPTDFINSVAPPSDLAVAFVVSQDNSGIVTFTPSGTSVASFTLNYGDGSEEETLIAGETVTHIYLEGTFIVTITGSNAIGETTQITQEVTLTFLPPENLFITINTLPGNSFGIEVSATADFASNFDVFFGDVTNEVPTNFLAGETTTHIYDAIGDYEVRVVARNGGSVTIETSQIITIENPIVLPINFEDTEQDYIIIGFEGAESSIMPNPDPTGINTSTTVVRTIKTPGAQFFAGTFTEVDLPIDFSTSGSISINTYSPKANIPVRIRLENANNSSGVELDVNTTVENQWETLTFDLSSQLDSNIQYVRIVVFFEFVPGLAGDGSIYYFDDIMIAN